MRGKKNGRKRTISAKGEMPVIDSNHAIKVQHSWLKFNNNPYENVVFTSANGRFYL